MTRRALIASLFVAPIAPKLARLINPAPKYFHAIDWARGSEMISIGVWAHPANQQAYREIAKLVQIIQKAK